MANKFTRYLIGESLGSFGKGIIGGIIKPKGMMADWQHASRVFVDDTFRLSPRHKFLYHAVFKIRKDAHTALAFTEKHSQEISVLVKTAELPKYNFDSVVKNQYNRKKLIYKNFNYEPVNFTFHDDNAGIVNSLWAIYYAAYIQDRKLPTQAYRNELNYRPSNTPLDYFRYGLDNDKAVDFFESISIYTMSRSRFNGYTLINPRIKSWSHGNVSYAEGDTIESSMQVEYESVQYSSGSVSSLKDQGFATLHYDFAPSPLSITGGGSASIFGEAGVLGGIESIFGDVAKGSTFDSPAGFLNTAIKSINTYNNVKEIKNKGLLGGELRGALGQIISSPAAIGGIVNTIGGIAGSVFPRNVPSGDSVVAAAKKFFG
jgi:hypothetical protein